MNTDLPGRTLEHEHQRIDRDLAAVLDGTANAVRLTAALELLRRHVYVEEEMLFGPIAEQGLAMPVYIMHYEHGLLWPLLERLTRAAESGAVDSGEALADGRRLQRLLSMHNPKEEDLIYAVADRLATADPPGIPALDLESVQAPPNWVCKALREDFAPPPGAPPWTPPNMD